MKKSMGFVIGMLLLSFLAACTGDVSAPETLGDDDRIATTVAATLSAVLTPSAASAASQAPSLSLEDFPIKVLLGENDEYAVYLLNSTGGDAMEQAGEIIVYNKGGNLVVPISGAFTFSGVVLVSNDGQGEYVFLSHGTYTSRKAIVIALNDKKQAVDEFCTAAGEAGDHFFWNEYVIFNNCDTFRNRPWGAGEAPSVMAINLATGLETVIARSDLTHQFHVQAIAGDNLQYVETSVDKEEDWQNPANASSIVHTYDLLTLGSGN